MAKAARVDNVVLVPDGGPVTITFQGGDSPLPVSPGGSSIVYASPQDLKDAISNLEQELNEEKLALIQVAAGLKKDPNMGASFISNTKGKTCTLDLLGATSPIVVG